MSIIVSLFFILEWTKQTKRNSIILPSISGYRLARYLVCIFVFMIIILVRMEWIERCSLADLRSLPLCWNEWKGFMVILKVQRLAFLLHLLFQFIGFFVPFKRLSLQLFLIVELLAFLVQRFPHYCDWFRLILLP